MASRKAATGIAKNRSGVVVAMRLLVYVGSLDTACGRGYFHVAVGGPLRDPLTARNVGSIGIQVEYVLVATALRVGLGLGSLLDWRKRRRQLPY